MFWLYTFYLLPNYLVSYDILFCIFLELILVSCSPFLSLLPLSVFSFSFSFSTSLSLPLSLLLLLSVCLSSPQEPPAFTAVKTGPCRPVPWAAVLLPRCPFSLPALGFPPGGGQGQHCAHLFWFSGRLDGYVWKHLIVLAQKKHLKM